MDYTLVKTNRKSISISVTKDATLLVRAPKRMSVKNIERFLNSKEDWINEHMSTALANKALRDSFTLDFDSKIMLRGKTCYILPTTKPLSSGPTELIDKYQIFVPENLSPEQILDKVRFLLIKYAKDFLPRRTMEVANQMGVMPSSVRVGNAKTRWGSCNSNGRINYTWKVIFSDDAVIDYLIVHELAHLRNMNHSSNFWSEVQQYAPKYKESRLALRELQKKLASEIW